MELTLLKTTIKTELGKAGMRYAVIMLDGVEVGFINNVGIHLRLYNDKVPMGVYCHVLPSVTGYNKCCQMVSRNVDAIYANFDLWIKKNPLNKIIQ